VAFQVEIDPFCREILAKNWPNAKRFADVRKVGSHNLPPVDVLCGGFPCTDLSVAGKGAGLDGSESGLWREFSRIIRELRPRIVVVENVPTLLARGLGDVLGPMAALGYDLEWDCIPASALGAPHQRDRIFIIAHTNRESVRVEPEWEQLDEAKRGHAVAAHPRGTGATPHTDGARPQELHPATEPKGSGFNARDPDSPWARGPVVSPICGVDDGFPFELDKAQIREVNNRLRALGNAVVPQVAEVIGHRVAEILGRSQK
jgi:DNA (cytosine-5)-methyltransferase 1